MQISHCVGGTSPSKYASPSINKSLQKNLWNYKPRALFLEFYFILANFVLVKFA